jgi:hypothetical protein
MKWDAVASVYAGDVNLLGGNAGTMKKKTHKL